MPTVEFYSFIPSLVDTMPIEKAKINNFEWYKKMYQDFVDNKQTPHTSRCPGILGVCNEGWIHKAYQDFVITTNSDERSFTWSCEVDQKKLPYGNVFGDYIDGHPENQLFKYYEFKRNTFKTIIKVQSPWVVKIPNGYSLLTIPIPYNDENKFTAAIGILKNTQFLNVQLFWHCIDERVLIKKGTPLCQYILLKDDEVDYSVNIMNQDVYTEVLTMLSNIHKKN